MYSTLSRLTRDAKAVISEVGPGVGPDRKQYVITEVDRWLTQPVEPEPHLQSLLFTKVTLALMLRRPAEDCLDTQRRAHLQRMRELTEIKRPGGLVDVMLADHSIYHLEADLRWIEATGARLDALREVVRP